MRTLVAAILLSSAAHAAPLPEIVLVGVSSGSIQDAVQMLAGEGQWNAEPDTQFAKLDLKLEAAPSIDRVEVQSCRGPFSDGAHLYTNFDQANLFKEGGKETLVFSFQKPLENIRWLTFNFRYNKGVCISAIRFLKDGKSVALKPSLINEKIVGSVVNLHDGRLDTGWSLEDTDRAAEMRFESERKIDRVKIWNGDQRSSGRYKASPRVKTLALFTDKQREVVPVKDSPEMQTIDLQNSIQGKVIRILVEEAYGGTIGDARLSEIQVGNGAEFFAVDVNSALRANADSRRASFESAKLGSILDRDIVVTDEDARWSIRVRTDGTIFMRGHSENLKRARDFSYIGKYKLKQADKKGVKVEVEGFLSNLPFELDASTCGRDCGGNPGPEPLFIKDEISFGRGKGGIIFVRDEGPRHSQRLEFKTLKARIAKDSE